MTLLVALGDVKADEELLASAGALAKAAGWELRAVHVRTPDEPFSDEGLGAEGFGAVGVDLTEVEGDPAATLASLVENAEISAVAVGLKTSDGPGLGRVAKAILATKAAPVLLVRKGMRPAMGLRRLLVPLEGSPSASVAMKRADDAFCRRGREIIMLHVVTNAPPSEQGSFPAPRIVDQEHYEWLAWQEEFCMRFSQCPEGAAPRLRARRRPRAGDRR